VKRVDDRRGATVIEVVVAVALAAGVLGFAISAQRFLSVRSVKAADEAQRLGEAARFVERLRRVLKLSAVRVVPVPEGFKVFHWVQDASGVWKLVETIFQRTGEEGVLMIVHPNGSQQLFRVGQAEGEMLSLEADEGLGLIRVRVVGLEVVESLGPPVRPRGAHSGRMLWDPEAPGSTLEEVQADEEATRGGWEDLEATVSLDPLPAGPAETEATGNESPGEEEAADVSEADRVISQSLADEADIAGVEVSNLGQVFLPQEPPAGTATPAAVLQGRLEQNGFSPEKAEAVATLTETWEEAVLSGDRREAAEALNGLAQIAEADGMGMDELVDQLATVSDLGEALVAESPAEVEAINAGTAIEPAPPPSLGTAGVEPVPTAELPGTFEPGVPGPGTTRDPAGGGGGGDPSGGLMGTEPEPDPGSTGDDGDDAM
jgi:hypothetical protein